MSHGEDRRARLARARLYLVSDAAMADDAVEAALAGGVDMLQLRDPALDDDALLEVAARWRAACDRHGALLWVNDRPDLALAAEADGVHVGQDDDAVAAVRERVGDDLLIGLSTHSPEQLEAGHRRRRRPAQRGARVGDADQARPPGRGPGVRAPRRRAPAAGALVRHRRDRPRQRRRGGRGRRRADRGRARGA